MPMPPTIKRNRRHGGKQKRHDAAGALRGFDELAQVAHVEVVDGAGLDAMAANERVARLPNGGVHQRLTDRLHVDLVGKAGQSRLQIVRIGPRQIGPIERRLLRGRRRDAKHFAFGRGERRHDKIVLIRAEHRLALGDEHADHLQRHALDQDGGADRVFAGTEELVVHRLPDDDDEVGLVFVLGRDAPPGGDLPVRDRRIVCVHALDGRRPVLVAVLHLPRSGG